MTKLPSLRRLFLPCFTFPATHPTTTTTTAIPTKKRLSTSLRDDNIDPNPSPKPDSLSSPESVLSHAPPRPSKSMVICTFFGPRHGSHIWFCVQHDRLSSKPSLLLELSLSTHNFAREIRSGFVRIALECKMTELGSCPLHSIPLWTLFCNGRRVGFAARRKPSEDTKLMLKKMENMTVGAGVIPRNNNNNNNNSNNNNGEECGEMMYMRANYEWSIGGFDSESFHLISPDDCPGQELSVFLLRSR